jgi:hypothetical protein
MNQEIGLWIPIHSFAFPNQKTNLGYINNQSRSHETQTY